MPNNLRIRRTLLGMVSLAMMLAFADELPAQDGGPVAEALSLHPGDFLRVEIWRETDLSGEFPIGLDGAVTVPLLGEIAVAGRPFAALRDEMLEEYRKQLRNPSIVITPLRRVNILGEVQTPGLYLVDPTISLVGAIAMAGGANARGNLGRIRIVREGSIVTERVRPEVTLGSADVRSNDQIFVGRRRWLDENMPSLLMGLPSLILSIIAIADRL